GVDKWGGGGGGGGRGGVGKNRGFPPPLHGMMNAVLHWWRWGFPLRCWSPSQHSRVSQRALGIPCAGGIGMPIVKIAHRIGRIGGRGCSRLLPSHASLIALPRLFLTLPPVCRGGKEGRAGEGGCRWVRRGCSPAS